MSTFKRYNGTNWETIGGGIAYSKYSTTEHVVGTWIDNKPIYRIVNTYTPTSSSKSYSLSSLSIDTLVDMRFKLYRESAINTDYGNYYNNANDYFRLFYRASEKTLQYRSPIVNGTLIVILEYTKTTD